MSAVATDRSGAALARFSPRCSLLSRAKLARVIARGKPGGMLDPSAAKRKWGEFISKKTELKLIADEKGPEKFKQRIRVSVKVGGG
jgi:hypothetical protein